MHSMVSALMPFSSNLSIPLKTEQADQNNSINCNWKALLSKSTEFKI